MLRFYFLLFFGVLFTLVTVAIDNLFFVKNRCELWLQIMHFHFIFVSNPHPMEYDFLVRQLDLSFSITGVYDTPDTSLFSNIQVHPVVFSTLSAGCFLQQR